MENEIIIDSTRKKVSIADGEGDSIDAQEDSYFAKPVIVIQTFGGDVMLNKEGATALRDFLNQYLIGYE